MKFKKSLTVISIMALLVLPALSTVNADATNSNTTWYNSPTLNSQHLSQVQGVHFNSKTAGGQGTYDVKLSNGKEVYGTPNSPLGKQIKAEQKKQEAEAKGNSNSSNSTKSESNKNPKSTKTDNNNKAKKSHKKAHKAKKACKSTTKRNKNKATKSTKKHGSFAKIGGIIIAIIVVLAIILGIVKHHNHKNQF